MPFIEIFTMNDCRICLGQVTLKNRVNVHTPVIDEIDVLEAIKEISSLEGSHDDLLPKCICKKCFNLLRSTTIFRNMIIDSYTQLIKKDPEASIQEINKDISASLNPEGKKINFTTEEVLCESGIRKSPSLPKPFPKRKKRDKNAKFKIKILKRETGESAVNYNNEPNGTNKECELKEPKNETEYDPEIITAKCNRSISEACTSCGKLIKGGKKKYKMHLKTHGLNESPLEYVCSICPKRYPKKEYLLVHTRSHTGEKPYHCNICDKNFSQFATYYVHKRRLHDKVVQGTCNYCGKMFVDKPELDVHIKMWHTGERPYLCEFCSATFVCNRTLQRHRKEIHSEKNPCQKCGKMLGAYAMKKHLLRHRVLEEGLKIVRKKYTCEYCETVMNFTSRRRHLEKQHGVKLHGRGDDCTKIPLKESDGTVKSSD